MQVLHTEIVEFGRSYLERLSDTAVETTKVGDIGADPLLGHRAEIWRYVSPNDGRTLYVVQEVVGSGADGVAYASAVVDQRPSEVDWGVIGAALKALYQ